MHSTFYIEQFISKFKKEVQLELWENDRQSEFSSGPGGQRNPGQHGQAGPSWGALALWGPGCPGPGRLAGVELCSF